MKRYFELCGFLILAFFSFYYTNKTMTVVKNTDDIMINIKNESENNKEAKDAVIEGNFIYPGVSGIEVDLSKSYDAMKKVGSYVPKLLKYKIVKPKISISNIYDKYIKKGNKLNKKISLIFKGNDIDNVIEILNKNNVKANFYTDNIDYTDHIIITKDIFRNHQKYCYLEKEDDEILNICSMNRMHTIIPNVIISKNYAYNIKKNIEYGNIIALDISDNLIKELDYIIKYIKSKGIDIVNLDNLLEE